MCVCVCVCVWPYIILKYTKIYKNICILFTISSNMMNTCLNHYDPVVVLYMVALVDWSAGDPSWPTVVAVNVPLNPFV